ncbi:hypothetical protein [Azospirillum argentinense]
MAGFRYFVEPAMSDRQICLMIDRPSCTGQERHWRTPSP